MTDLEIVRELEKELNIKRKTGQYTFGFPSKITFETDENKHVVEIDLSNNNIESIPKNLLRLTNLRSIILGENKLNKISPLLKLKKIEYLDLHENEGEYTVEDLGEFITGAKNIRVINLFDASSYDFFPKELLNHNLPLILDEGNDFGLFIDTPPVFPPEQMIRLGYNNPKFYYDNYPDKLIDTYKIRSTRTYNKPSSTESVLNETKNTIIKSLLEKYYLSYEKVHELPFAIRKIFIKDYHGIDVLLLNNISLDESKKSIKDPQWIFLTGENGYGKTSILQSFVIGLFGNEDAGLIINSGAEIHVEIKNGNEYQINASHTDSNEGEQFKNFAAYGPSRLNKSNDEMPQTYNLFNSNGKLLDIEGSLKLWFKKTDNHRLYENISRIILKLLQPYIDKIDIKENKGDYTVIYHEKNTKANEWKIYDELASGYKSIIAMFGDMILRLRKNQPNVKNAKDLAGIVIIDEFDLHLHPKWQRDLVQRLTKTFPNIQFIVSTHSPIPLLGAPPNKTVILNVNRTKEEGITVKRLEKLEKELKILSPNQLLTSDIFGMEEIENIYLTENEFDKVPIEDYQKDIEENKQIKKELEKLAKNKELFPENLFSEDN